MARFGNFRVVSGSSLSLDVYPDSASQTSSGNVVERLRAAIGAGASGPLGGLEAVSAVAVLRKCADGSFEVDCEKDEPTSGGDGNGKKSSSDWFVFACFIQSSESGFGCGWA